MTISPITASLYSLFINRLDRLGGVTHKHCSAAVVKQVGGKSDLFLAAYAYFLNQLHASIMDSWERFSRTLKEQGKEKKREHLIHARQKAEEEAMKREGELCMIKNLIQSDEGKALLIGLKRQADRFFVDGASPILLQTPI